MKSVFKPLLIATVMATVSVTALAWGPGGRGCDGPMGGGGPMSMMGGYGPMGSGGYGAMGQRGGKFDPARMQARMDQHQAWLKAELKLTAAQEGAWTAFTAAMKPTGNLMASMQTARADLAKLTTPERIDKMQALHTAHQAERTAMMNQRAEATKTFYAVLTPEQQKVFDAKAMPGQGKRGGPRGAQGQRGAGMGPGAVAPK